MYSSVYLSILSSSCLLTLLYFYFRSPFLSLSSSAHVSFLSLLTCWIMRHSPAFLVHWLFLWLPCDKDWCFLQRGWAQRAGTGAAAHTRHIFFCLYHSNSTSLSPLCLVALFSCHFFLQEPTVLRMQHLFSVSYFYSVIALFSFSPLYIQLIFVLLLFFSFSHYSHPVF